MITEQESIANLNEMLIVEILKVANLEHKKADEQKKEKPDAEAIARWDKASRAANERKAALKNRTDKRLKECIESGQYPVQFLARDFD